MGAEYVTNTTSGFRVPNLAKSCICLVLSAGLLVAVESAAGAQSAATALVQQDIEGRSDRHLKIMAAQYEREEAWTEAALVYEEMVKRDEGQAQLFGRRLVDIYLELREPEQAVEWARRIKDRTPDPVGWMADVYYRAGAHDQAIETLKHHASLTSDMQQRCRYLHQLADLHAQRGKVEKAARVLAEAATVALNGPYEGLAFRKLCAFHHERGSLEQHVKEWEAQAAAEAEGALFAQRALAEARKVGTP